MKTGKGGRVKTTGRRPNTKRTIRPHTAAEATDDASASLASTPGRDVSAQGEIMAEEKPTNSAAKKSQEAKKSAKDDQRALATEKPVPSAPVQKTSQYVVTVDNQTGVASKIEKLDDETGARQELTGDEYAQVLFYGGFSAAPFYAGLGAHMTSSAVPEGEALVQAYYRGVSAYLDSLTTSK